MPYKRITDERKKNHQCTSCGKDLGALKTSQCNECLQRHRDRTLEKETTIQRRKRLRLCRSCGKKLLSSERSSCRACLDKRALSKSTLSLEKSINRTLSRRASRYLRKYNITIEEYNRMFREQEGVCYICHLPETNNTRGTKICELAVDHEEETGKVRGLLCRRCNTVLGLVKENTQILKNMIIYLDKPLRIWEDSSHAG